jgi:myosin-5
VKISKQDQENVFTMVAAVLWLGNITFLETDHENYVSVNDDEGKLAILNLIL